VCTAWRGSLDASANPQRCARQRRKHRPAAGRRHDFHELPAKRRRTVPMQVTRERDGRRIAQVFYDSCQVNRPLPADYFTREALVQRFKETGGKKPK